MRQIAKPQTKHSLICCYIHRRQFRERFYMLERSWKGMGLSVISPKRFASGLSAQPSNSEASAVNLIAFMDVFC